MTIYVYPADPYGCGRYRLIWPAEALKAAGYSVRIIMPSNREGLGGSVDSRTGRLVDANAQAPPDPLGLGREMPTDAEAIILQRVSSANTSAAVRMLRRKGVAVIVDMDDDLTKIDPANPAFYGMGVKTGDPRHNWRNAHQACLDATLVTVSTPALLPIYAPHGRGVVIENRVPAAFLDIPHEDNDSFGWPGAVHSHPNDLQTIGPAAAQLVRGGARYFGIGPDFGYAIGDGALRRALGLDDDPECSGNVDFAEWPFQLTRLGVGMAPLADTGFNAAKSWLKPLEMMACGVPWVGSPRAEYARLRERTGVGILAKRPRDWFREIGALVRDPQRRLEMSAAGREAVREMTIEGNAWRWLEAWTQKRP